MRHPARQGTRATGLAARAATAAVAALALLLVPSVAHADEAPTSTGTTTAPATPTDDPTTSAPPTTVPPTTVAPTAETPVAPKTETKPAPNARARAVLPADRLPFGKLSARAAPAAAAAPMDAQYAAGFIARTLTAGGDHYVYPGGTYLDGGNTIDAILGIDGAGAGLTAADAATDYLGAHVDDYIGAGGETYAGPTAKLVLGVVAQGGDPTDFGGANLVTRLAGLEAADGHFKDVSGFGDYSNTIGQSLAIIAVGRATGTTSQASVDYLLSQQCADGGFRGELDKSPCVTDPDATAFAAQALVGALGADDPHTTKAIDRLAALQGATGGFSSADGLLNANTTAVAAQAFAAGGRTTDLAQAQAFLRTLQYDCSFPVALRGGIAFTAADKAARAKAGTKAVVDDTDLRATPQSTLALAGGSLLDVTADGAADDAPALTCAVPTTTTTTTTGTTAAATTTAAAAAPANAAMPGSLAYTGATIWPLALIAFLLLLTGAAAVTLSRRPGGRHS